MITATVFRAAGVVLLLSATACGGISNPASPPSDFSSGNFAMNIVASNTCSTLADAGRNRGWRLNLVKTGSSVIGYMQGWSDKATVSSQTTLAGTANGSSLSLTGSIYDTVAGCAEALCYRAEGTITATQSGNVINGTLNGVLTYEFTTCSATDHKVTFTRE
ncbi:MAG TPA: hypothetical protein VL882_27325 [Vicinamibacterales bacterium]|nr:hypothetical protein [Vicinamibacterales bacterium]